MWSTQTVCVRYRGLYITSLGIDVSVSDLIDPQVSSPAFTIENPPSASENMQLVTDLLIQDQHRRLKDATLCFLEAPKSGSLRGGINSESNVSWDLRPSHEEHHGLLDIKGLSQCALEYSHPEALKGDDTSEQLRSFTRINSVIHRSTTVFHISSLEVNILRIARKTPWD